MAAEGAMPAALDAAIDRTRRVPNSSVRTRRRRCRGQEALAGFYQDLTPEQLEAIEAVAMDMWKP